MENLLTTDVFDCEKRKRKRQEKSLLLILYLLATGVLGSWDRLKRLRKSKLPMSKI